MVEVAQVENLEVDRLRTDCLDTHRSDRSTSDGVPPIEDAAHGLRVATDRRGAPAQNSASSAPHTTVLATLAGSVRGVAVDLLARRVHPARDLRVRARRYEHHVEFACVASREPWRTPSSGAADDDRRTGPLRRLRERGGVVERSSAGRGTRTSRRSASPRARSRSRAAPRSGRTAHRWGGSRCRTQRARGRSNPRPARARPGRRSSRRPAPP